MTYRFYWSPATLFMEKTTTELFITAGVVIATLAIRQFFGWLKEIFDRKNGNGNGKTVNYQVQYYAHIEQAWMQMSTAMQELSKTLARIDERLSNMDKKL